MDERREPARSAAGTDDPELRAAQDPEAQDRAFAQAFQRFLAVMAQRGEPDGNRLTPLGELVQDHLGVDLGSVDPVTEQFPRHQVVDVDRAAHQLVQDSGGRLVGLNGPNKNHVDSFLDFLTHGHWKFDQGPVSYARMATGPSTDQRVITFGMTLLTFEDIPLAVLHRASNRHYGRDAYTLEVLCPDPAAVDRYLARIRELMAEHSILRGQVISFSEDNFDRHDPGNGLRFLERPEISAEQVILPDGVLERVTRHVVGIGQSRAALRRAGQHLKRGVLLYGPPGTGKTHLVRHLLSRTPETTAVLLSGRTLGLLNDATKLARANQPALIVLEDCDLVAEQRGGDTNAALFETLEALDGLDGDADIAFVLTTNRPDLLERALVERPGRVDLAVEIDKPGTEARRLLLQLYAGPLSFSPETLQRAAEETEGATASYAKELIRRAVLGSAQHGREPGDADLLTALAEMTSEAEAFTRTLLGGGVWVPSESEGAGG